MTAPRPECPAPSLEMIARPCPVCSTEDVSRVFAPADFDPAVWDGFAFASRKLPEYMHYRLISCPRCDLLYANPIPSLPMLARAYEDASFDSAAEAADASRTYAELLAAHWPPGLERRGVLDIGTGDGAFLARLQEQGFADVAGVEPSAAPIAAAPSSVRPLIRQGLFQAADYAPEQFRLITCFQTVEHLYDPLTMCRDARHLLQPGGVLFLVCHNRRAWSARLLGLKSPIFDIEHLQLFSPGSARRLLEESGFTNIVVRPIVNRYPLHYLLKLFPLPLSIKRRCLAWAQNHPLGQWHISVALGNLAVFGVKKP